MSLRNRAAQQAIPVRLTVIPYGQTPFASGEFGSAWRSFQSHIISVGCGRQRGARNGGADSGDWAEFEARHGRGPVAGCRPAGVLDF